MPSVTEPTMHEMLWEWLETREYQVSGEVSVGEGRIDLVAYNDSVDEYIGFELKDQEEKRRETTVPSAFGEIDDDAVRVSAVDNRDGIIEYWDQLYQYQTSGYLDRVYFASQRPHSIFKAIDDSAALQARIERIETADETDQDPVANHEDIGAVRVPGPQEDGTIEIVREAAKLPRENEVTMSRTDESWVDHYIWEHLGDIREGVLPNQSSSHFRRIDVAKFTHSEDPTEVYKNQPEHDIIGYEAKGKDAVCGDTTKIEQQLLDYLSSGGLTQLYLAVPEEDSSDALAMLENTRANNQSNLDKVGLYSVDKSGSVRQLLEAEQVTLEYDGIHTKEGYITDIIWGYADDDSSQYNSIFGMRDQHQRAKSHSKPITGSLPPDSSGLFFDDELQDHNFAQSSFTEDDVGTSLREFDLTNVDTSNVEDMSAMFVYAQSFDQDIGSWDTSNVEDMSDMFIRAQMFDQDIGNWDTSNVEDMTDMFLWAHSFDQDISAWCVERITQKPSRFDEKAGFEGNDANQPNWGDDC